MNYCTDIIISLLKHQTFDGIGEKAFWRHCYKSRGLLADFAQANERLGDMDKE